MKRRTTAKPKKPSADQLPSALTETEQDLLSHLQNGYQLETASLGGDLLLRNLKTSDVIRPLSATRNTVKALQERGLIAPAKATMRCASFGIFRKQTPRKNPGTEGLSRPTVLRQPSVPDKIAASPLLALHQRAVGRSRFPCAGVIEPGVAADDRSCPVLALEFGLVSERVMRDGGIRAETRYLHVADAAALPLVRLVLQIFDEILLGFPIAPAVSRNEAVGQMLLRPRGIVFHLRFPGFLLQFFDLVGGVAAGLSVEVDAKSETTEQSMAKITNLVFKFMSSLKRHRLYTSAARPLTGEAANGFATFLFASGHRLSVRGQRIPCLPKGLRSLLLQPMGYLLKSIGLRAA